MPPDLDTLDPRVKADGSLEYKSAVTGVKVLDEGEGIVQAVVSVTNVVDRVNDKILPGAYRKTLKERMPKGLRGHDWQRMVAKTLHAEELMPGDPRIKEIAPRIARAGGGGLLIRGQFNLNTQVGREAYEDAKFFGEDAEWSVGYKVPKGASRIVHRTGTREIKAMDLYEWSDVAFGAAPLTAGTTSVKSAIAGMIEVGELSPDEILEWAELAGVKGLGELEEKVRKVRTPKGARHFDRPIGSPILPGEGRARGGDALDTRQASRGDHPTRNIGGEEVVDDQIDEAHFQDWLQTQDDYMVFIQSAGLEEDPEYEQELRERFLEETRRRGQKGADVDWDSYETECEGCGKEFPEGHDAPGTPPDGPLSHAADDLPSPSDSLPDTPPDGDSPHLCDDCFEKAHTEPDLETKLRRVRTPEGAEKYGQPIGTVIRPGGGIPGRLPGKKPNGRGKAKGPTQSPAARAKAAFQAARDRYSDTPDWKRVQTDLIRTRGEASKGLNPDYPGLSAGGDPVRTGDLDEALEALKEGKRVELESPGQVATLLDRMNEIVAHALEEDKRARQAWADKGRDDYDAALGAKLNPAKRAEWIAEGNDEADLEDVIEVPNYNLCGITVRDSNLFCKEHKGIERIKMPQLSGIPVPGSPADDDERFPKDEKGEVDIAQAYREFLAEALGHDVDEGEGVTEPASSLKATQSELVGGKVAGIYQGVKAGKVKSVPIFTTRDQYVVDGHHRWAAVVAVDSEDMELGDISMPVRRIDADILDIIDITTEWTTWMGIPPKAGSGAGVSVKWIGGKLAYKWVSDVGNPEWYDDWAEKDGDIASSQEELADLLDPLTDDEWGRILDAIHEGDDLGDVKSHMDAVELEFKDEEGATEGEQRARYLTTWWEGVYLGEKGAAIGDVEGLDDYPEALERKVSSRVYPDLERVPGKQNWVDYAGGLPSYIERIAKHLHYERGFTISRAIATAVNRVKKWAAGAGGVKPSTRAKAAKAVAQWEAKKAKSKARRAARRAAKSLLEGHGMGLVTNGQGAGEDVAEEDEMAWAPPWEKSVEQLTEHDVAELWTLIGEWQEKREFSSRRREELAEEGAAMPGGRYPIVNRSDLLNAIRAYGRGAPGDKPAIMRHIKKRARALGLTDLIPDDWKTDDAAGSETKREFSSGQRERAAEEGAALPDGSYPIRNRSDLRNAIQAFGRAKNKSRTKRHIIKRARALGGTDMLPDDWNVSKGDDWGDLEDKAGRMLSGSNATAIREALGQLVQVLNRAGIAWGEDEGEAGTATKAGVGTRGTRKMRGDEEDEGEGSEEAADEDEMGGVPAAEGAATAEEEEEEEKTEEEEERRRGKKVYLPLGDLLEAAELRLTSI